MEFHQRNNALHPGRRSTGWQTFLVGILRSRAGLSACLTLSSARSQFSSTRFNVELRENGSHSCWLRAPLPGFVTLRQWLSTRAICPPGQWAMSGSSFDCNDWEVLLLSPGQECCKTSCNAQGGPQTKNYPSQVWALQLRNRALE